MNTVPDSVIAPLPGDRAAMVGEIIVTARRIEALLRQGAESEAPGIHALTEILSSQLPATLQGKLHYLASVRNQAAHEEEFALTAEEFAAFRCCAAEVEEDLSRRFADKPVPGERNDGANASSGAEWEVERELWMRWAHTIHNLGFVPVLSVCNLLRLLIGTIYEQIGAGLLIVFYFCAIPMIIEGFRGNAQSAAMLKLGIAIAAAVYIATLIMGWKRKVPGLPRIFYWVPGLHIGYLVMWWGRNMAWGRFFLTAAGIAALITTLALAANGRWTAAGWALLTQWLIGVIAALLWPVKD